MKKNIAIFLSFILLSFVPAKADIAVGITGAMHSIDIDGTETTRTSGQKNTGSHSEDVTVPEFFVETYGNSVSLGLSYIPTREMGSKSRTDTGDQSAGTYKAEAELDNVVQLYADINVTEYAGADIYIKAGVQHATIKTLESLNSGSTYPDQDVLGYTLGLGAKGDLVGNFYYKADLTYTDFEDYSSMSDGNTGNKVEASLEDVAAKLSIGYKF